MISRTLFRHAKATTNILSFEFLLTIFKWPNGGTVIFIRAFFISFLAITVYGILTQLFDPNRFFVFDARQFQLQVVESIKIFGPVFAAVYLALYSRFSSQWGYLSNLYNQIKEAEVAMKPDKKTLNHWKAGFIEDAVELHLALKPMFATIIKGWGEDPKIQKAFETGVSNGKAIFKSLMKDINMRLSEK